MKRETAAKTGLFHTNDHHWIRFRDTEAYIGISHFKLNGFKEIQQVIFSGPPGFKKKGDLVATIKYNDHTVEAHMPVDGIVLEFNSNLVYGDDDLLLKHPESNGWIGLIEPSDPAGRKDLLLPGEYPLKANT